MGYVIAAEIIFLRFNVNIFNIQDEDDFKKRVVESKTPVLVDFHARCLEDAL